MEKSIAKNAIAKILLNVFNLIIPLIIGPYILRIFGPTINGEINYVQSIYGYFFIFASFGVYQYGLREISKIRDDKDKLNTLFSSLFVITVITNIITIILYLITVHFMNINSSIYYILLVFSFNLMANIFYVEWINEALEEYSFITMKTIIIKIVYIILLLIMVKTSEDVYNYLALLILSTFLNNFVSYIHIKRKINFKFKNVEIKKHIIPMFSVVIISNANVLYTQLDRIMLGKYVNVDVVSYYTIAQTIVNMINATLLSIVLVSIPRLSNYIGNNNIKAYNNLMNKISRSYLLLLFPAVLGIISISTEIIYIYAGNEYMLAVPILSVFAIYVITSGFEVILTNQIMYIFNKEKILVKLTFVFGGVNLILKILLVKFDLLTGVSAIFTTMISNILLIICIYTYIKKNIKVEFNIFSIDKLKYAIISVFFIPIGIVVRSLISNYLISFMVTIIVSMIFYFGVLFIIKDDVIKELYENLINKLNKK